MVFLCAGLLLLQADAGAQNKRTAKKKKTRHRHVRVISNHSDNDKQLEQIKKQKDKER
jgi:hypothetical protein